MAMNATVPMRDDQQHGSGFERPFLGFLANRDLAHARHALARAKSL